MNRRTIDKSKRAHDLGVLVETTTGVFFLYSTVEHTSDSKTEIASSLTNVGLSSHTDSLAALERTPMKKK